MSDPGEPSSSVGGRSGSLGVRTPALLASAEIFSALTGEDTTGAFSVVDSCTNVVYQRGQRPSRGSGSARRGQDSIETDLDTTFAASIVAVA